MKTKEPRIIEFSIQEGDITSFDADVLALKYAQAFYKTDGEIADLLSSMGIASEKLRPRIGEHSYIETQNAIQARHALFVGVPSLVDFDYQDIQAFSTRVLSVLTDEAPTTKHLVMTIHGVGFGLDEGKSLLAQFTGYLNAIQSEQLPSSLEYISIIDNDLERVQRLRQVLEQHLADADYASRARTRWAYHLDIQKIKDAFRSYQSSFNAGKAETPNETTRTRAEAHLLDVIKHLKSMGKKERHVRLTRAVNAVLKEAMRDGYELDFGEMDGIHLDTPEGLSLWFLPKNKKNNWNMEVFVTDCNNKLPSDE